MSKVLRFDDKIEAYLNEQIIKLKQLGLKNVSKPDALRFMIEQNRVVQLKIKKEPIVPIPIKVKRKRSSKKGLLFQ